MVPVGLRITFILILWISQAYPINAGSSVSRSLVEPELASDVFSQQLLSSNDPNDLTLDKFYNLLQLQSLPLNPMGLQGLGPSPLQGFPTNNLQSLSPNILQSLGPNPLPGIGSNPLQGLAPNVLQGLGSALNYNNQQTNNKLQSTLISQLKDLQVTLKYILGDANQNQASVSPSTNALIQLLSQNSQVGLPSTPTGPINLNSLLGRNTQGSLPSMPSGTLNLNNLLNQNSQASPPSIPSETTNLNTLLFPNSKIGLPPMLSGTQNLNTLLNPNSQASQPSSPAGNQELGIWG